MVYLANYINPINLQYFHTTSLDAFFRVSHMQLWMAKQLVDMHCPYHVFIVIFMQSQLAIFFKQVSNLSMEVSNVSHFLSDNRGVLIICHSLFTSTIMIIIFMKRSVHGDGCIINVLYFSFVGLVPTCYLSGSFLSCIGSYCFFLVMFYNTMLPGAR